MRLAGALVLSLCAAPRLYAQAQSSHGSGAAVSSGADGLNEPLPDAPDAVPTELKAVQSSTPKPQSVKSASGGSGVPARTHETTHYDNMIDPTEIAPKLDATDKIVMGMKAAVTPYAMIGWVGIASYEQAFNRSPNYGETGKGYMQRLGAAAARGSSEGIFTHSVYAPIFHTDPRYYVLGPGHGFVQRAGYAITRVLVTKTDSGAGTVNFALLMGNLTGAAVTQTYYPAGNRNLEQVMTTFGTSLAGSAFGYLFDEFIVNSADFLKLKHTVDLRRGSGSR